jgi:DNA-binding response OmpR family regulator
VNVLICEPHAEVRALLAHVVTRLGFEPVYADARSGGAQSDTDVDILLLEPADPAALSTARALRLRRRELPIICASIYPDLPDAEGLHPLAYLIKPFALIDLERALLAAVESAVAQA